MATPSSADHETGGAWPNWVALVLGVWLFISAFVWPHILGAQTNTWILGVLITATAIWALFVPQVRFLNIIFSVWLFFSAFFMVHTNPGTRWNNVIVAIIVFLCSLIPSGRIGYSIRRPIHA